MRLTLVIFSLGGGGAERVMARLANHWAADDQEVTLITLDVLASDVYTLDPRITRDGLGMLNASGNSAADVPTNLRRVLALRRAIKGSRPDVVISFIDKMNLLTVLATRGLNVPLVISERTDPTQHVIGWFGSGLRRVLYPRANALVVQTDSVRRWADAIVPPERIHVISNPVDPPILGDRSTIVTANGRTVVGMGRLIPEKGFDYLIRAFARATRTQRGWNLLILGEGPERQRLEALADRLGLNGSVCLPGRVDGPSTVLAASDIFVMTSRYEGFPNAMLEAMAVGLPVLSFDCPSGPRHIIRDGVDGVLVAPGDEDVMAAELETLMADDTRRASLGRRAPDVLDRFGLQQVMSQWDSLLAYVADAAT